METQDNNRVTNNMLQQPTASPVQSQAAPAQAAAAQAVAAQAAPAQAKPVLSADTEAYLKANELSPAKANRPHKHKKLKKLRRQLRAVSIISAVLITALLVGLVVTSVKLSRETAYHLAIYNNSEKLTPSKRGDKISLHDATLGDIEIPALEGVAVNTYDNDCFTDENGLKYYYSGGELCSYTGVDVSAHNGDIDWAAVRAAGIDFAMIRIGGRGYGSEGVLYSDDYLQTNISGAKAAGLLVGAYFFSQAATPQEAVEEAQYAVELLNGASLDYPLAFDWEIVETEDETRIDNIPAQTLTDCARAFCDEVSKKGYIPSIYTDARKSYYKYDLSQLADVELWYVAYTDRPAMYYNFTMWQYSCTGQVNGIAGDVDLNICFKNYK